MSKTKLALIAVAGILLASQLSSAATSAAVGALHCKSSLVHFTTVQDAVDHVELSGPGGTVFVCPGTYQEQVTINQSLTLTGVPDGSQDAPVITSPAAGFTFTVPDLRVALIGEIGRAPLAPQIYVSNTGASITVNISNLIVDGANNLISSCSPDLIGILYQNANGTINHVTTRNQIITPYSTNGGCQSGMGVLVQNDNTQTVNASLVTVTSSTVHSFQKNGIAGQLKGTTLKATSNTVLGLGPTTGAAQNGIEIAYGAGGTVSSNSVSDFDFSPNTDTAAGILNFDSGGIIISGNTVANAQEGIAVAEVTANDTNGTSITSNKVYGSHAFDGIDVCGDGTTVKSNTVNSSDEAGIHNDSTCTGGNTGNVISGNTINEACAGLLTGTAPTNSANLGPNTFFNVVTTVLGGDTCGTPVFSSFARTSGGASSRFQP